jgi:nucleotide-binding universal stress UspA family protein
MFQRILVPLDGSRRAEHAIPLAAHLAQVSAGTLIFVRVVLPPHEIGTFAAEWEQSVVVRPDAHEKRLAEAEVYLTETIRAYASALQGIKIELDVETGAVAPAILSATRLEATDLIVLCSRGETGLARWILGSVARETMRQSPVPLLVLNESGGIFLEQPAERPVRVLVPLDGSALSEEALQPALQLLAAVAPRSDGELHLLHIVDLPATYGYTRSQANIPTSMHEEARQEAETYLTDLVARLRAQLPAEARPAITWSVAINPDVAGAILTQAAMATHAEGNGCDIIALATHGHSGLRTLIMGSVATRLLGVSKQPLLIVRPQQNVLARTPVPGKSTAGHGVP